MKFLKFKVQDTIENIYLRVLLKNLPQFILSCYKSSFFVYLVHAVVESFSFPLNCMFPFWMMDANLIITKRCSSVHFEFFITNVFPWPLKRPLLIFCFNCRIMALILTILMIMLSHFSVNVAASSAEIWNDLLVGFLRFFPSYSYLDWISPPCEPCFLIFFSIPPLISTIVALIVLSFSGATALMNKIVELNWIDLTSLLKHWNLMEWLIA